MKARMLGALALFTVLELLGPASARAATFSVDRTDDSATATGCVDATPNDCSLRGAILKLATAGAGPHQIVLPAGTYTLTIPGAGETAGHTGDLNIHGQGPLTIRGAGAADTIVRDDRQRWRALRAGRLDEHR